MKKVKEEQTKLIAGRLFTKTQFESGVWIEDEDEERDIWNEKEDYEKQNLGEVFFVYSNESLMLSTYSTPQRKSIETLSDAFKFIGHRRSDDFKQIRKTYKKLSKYYHPDRSTGNLEKYIQLNTSMELISSFKEKLKDSN